MTFDVEQHWRELVSIALLGTDRRDPPAVAGPIGDLVADTVRQSPSDRMLADVAASTAVRRAAFLPAASIPTLVGPRPDERPTCLPAAVERWHHVVASWPVLEDEWMVTLIERGWRVDPRLVPAMLVRHRRDPIRWARVVVAAGPLAEWLVEHGVATGPLGMRPQQRVGAGPSSAGQLYAGQVDAEQLMTVPVLPIPPDLVELCAQPGDEVGGVLAAGLTGGSLGTAHRAVLVNLVARTAVDTLPAIAQKLGGVDPTGANFGLSASLADLAWTRSLMLDELSTAH